MKKLALLLIISSLFLRLPLIIISSDGKPVQLIYTSNIQVEQQHSLSQTMIYTDVELDDSVISQVIYQAQGGGGLPDTLSGEVDYDDENIILKRNEKVKLPIYFLVDDKFKLNLKDEQYVFSERKIRMDYKRVNWIQILWMEIKVKYEV